jgi:hypothetical protein
MTSEERIQSINDRMEAGSFTILQLTTESGYQGVWHAIRGTSSPSIYNLEKMEAALTRLESK